MAVHVSHDDVDDDDDEVEQHENGHEQGVGDGEEAEQYEIHEPVAGEVEVEIEEEEEKEEKGEEEDGQESEVQSDDLEERRKSLSESGHLALDRLEQEQQKKSPPEAESDDEGSNDDSDDESWPWLRAAIDRVRDSPKVLAIAYLCFLLLAAVFGALIFVDVEDANARADAWIASFGVATLLALVAASLLLAEPAKDTEDQDEEEAEDEREDEREPAKQRETDSNDDSDDESEPKRVWLDALANTLKENHNANRLFVILEAVFDLVLAQKNLEQSDEGLPEYDILLAAIVAAVMALFFTVLDIVLFYTFRNEMAFIRAQRTTEPLFETIRARAREARAKAKSERDDEDTMAIRAERCLFRYWFQNRAFILALILSDLADILLLSRSAVVMQFETKDLLLFIFLLSNVLVSEVFTGVANLFESFAAQVLFSEMSYEEEEKAEKELASAAALRTSLRRKANAQTIVTGLVVIPLMIAVALYVSSIVTVEDVCVIVVPFLLLACANLVLASAEFDYCSASTRPDSWLVKACGCMLGYVRVFQLSPRLFAGIWSVIGRQYLRYDATFRSITRVKETKYLDSVQKRPIAAGA